MGALDLDAVAAVLGEARPCAFCRGTNLFC